MSHIFKCRQCSSYFMGCDYLNGHCHATSMPATPSLDNMYSTGNGGGEAKSEDRFTPELSPSKEGVEKTGSPAKPPPPPTSGAARFRDFVYGSYDQPGLGLLSGMTNGSSGATGTAAGSGAGSGAGAGVGVMGNSDERDSRSAGSLSPAGLAASNRGHEVDFDAPCITYIGRPRELFPSPVELPGGPPASSPVGRLRDQLDAASTAASGDGPVAPGSVNDANAERKPTEIGSAVGVLASNWEQVRSLLVRQQRPLGMAIRHEAMARETSTAVSSATATAAAMVAASWRNVYPRAQDNCGGERQEASSQGGGAGQSRPVSGTGRRLGKGGSGGASGGVDGSGDGGAKKDDDGGKREDDGTGGTARRPSTAGARMKPRKSSASTKPRLKGAVQTVVASKALGKGGAAGGDAGGGDSAADANGAAAAQSGTGGDVHTANAEDVKVCQRANLPSKLKQPLRQSNRALVRRAGRVLFTMLGASIPSPVCLTFTPHHTKVARLHSVFQCLPPDLASPVHAPPGKPVNYVLSGGGGIGAMGVFSGVGGGSSLSRRGGSARSRQARQGWVSEWAVSWACGDSRSKGSTHPWPPPPHPPTFNLLRSLNRTRLPTRAPVRAPTRAFSRMPPAPPHG